MQHCRKWIARRAAYAAAAIMLACLAPSARAAGPADAAELQAGRTLFISGAVPACAVCHTLAEAGASGQVGPSLDELKPDAGRVEMAVRNCIGVMPAFESLSDEEVAAVSRYVAHAVAAE